MEYNFTWIENSMSGNTTDICEAIIYYSFNIGNITCGIYKEDNSLIEFSQEHSTTWLELMQAYQQYRYVGYRCNYANSGRID